jgi:uncharacterized membrane protein
MRNKPVKSKQDLPSHNLLQVKTHERREVSFSPVPPAGELESLEKIHPGITERILRMAEKEQEVRHKNNHETIELEKKNVENINSNVRLGQWLAFGSVLVSTGLCIIFAYLGDIQVAGSTAKWVIASLAALFITGRLVKGKLNID